MNILELSDKKYNRLKLILTKRFKHTKKRVKERFGLNLPMSHYYQLINEILNKNSVLLYNNDYVEFHCLLYKNTNIIVVYEPETMSIRTALTLEQFR